MAHAALNHRHVELSFIPINLLRLWETSLTRAEIVPWDNCSWLGFCSWMAVAAS